MARFGMFVIQEHDEDCECRYIYVCITNDKKEANKFWFRERSSDDDKFTYILLKINKYVTPNTSYLSDESYFGYYNSDINIVGYRPVFSSDRKKYIDKVHWNRSQINSRTLIYGFKTCRVIAPYPRKDTIKIFKYSTTTDNDLYDRIYYISKFKIKLTCNDILIPSIIIDFF